MTLTPLSERTRTRPTADLIEGLVDATLTVLFGQGLREDVAHQCLLNLANAGLVTTTPVYEGSAYPLTELGRSVIRAARATSD